MENNICYTALTIGPIVETLGMAHKVREIWAASFMFSKLMEEVIEALKPKLNENLKLIIPYKDKNKNDIPRAGVFPDRLIIQSKDGFFDSLSEIVENAIQNVAESLKINSKDDVVEYLKKFIRAYIIETEIDSGNVVEIISNYLANCELQSKYIPEDSQLLLDILLKINNSKLFEEAIGKDNRFPSLIEITTKGLNEEIYLEELYSRYNNDDTELWYEIVKRAENRNKTALIKQAHKYIAIVQSDGDNVGKLGGEIYKSDPEKISIFSKALSDFSAYAAKCVQEFGAEPIYAGGDDLLFFAPIISKEDNVFDIIKKIDNIFIEKIYNNEHLKPLIDNLVEKPSMSYGVSITYYKYPMHEALKQARGLLFDVAKKTKDKNAIAFKVLTHSGSYYETVLNKKSDLYGRFKELLSQKNDNNIISSLIYKVRTLKPLLKEIANDEKRLEYFFENFFNQDFHKNYLEFIDNVRCLIFLANKEEMDFDKAIQKVYSILRFVKFLGEKYDE